MSSLSILQIGGSGFLSGTLARAATAAGHDVTVVTRGQRDLPAGVTAITVDRTDHRAFAEAIKSHGHSFDLVVDCIAYTPDDAQQDIAVFRECAKHLVLISTDFVYEPSKRTFPQTEAHPYYAGGPYGSQKRQCELALANGDTVDMKWTVLRPCHIYGPGSKLGCLPTHSRDSALLDHLRSGKPLQLVGGGYFLQQPILARDLANMILSCAGNGAAHGEIFLAAGPDVIESWWYYKIVADVLGVSLSIEELPVRPFLKENPNTDRFLCHRFYDRTKSAKAGLYLPDTSIDVGLREHIESFR